MSCTSHHDLPSVLLLPSLYFFLHSLITAHYTPLIKPSPQVSILLTHTLFSYSYFILHHFHFSCCMFHVVPLAVFSYLTPHFIVHHLFSKPHTPFTKFSLHLDSPHPTHWYHIVYFSLHMLSFGLYAPFSSLYALLHILSSPHTFLTVSHTLYTILVNQFSLPFFMFYVV